MKKKLLSVLLCLAMVVACLVGCGGKGSSDEGDVTTYKVVDAEIPVVLINREPLAYDADGNTIDEAYEGIVDNANVCYVGADARQSGTYQGEIVLALPDKGDINGDAIEVIFCNRVKQGQEAGSTAMIR